MPASTIVSIATQPGASRSGFTFSAVRIALACNRPAVSGVAVHPELLLMGLSGPSFLMRLGVLVWLELAVRLLR
jgi:hypothetical protein